MSGFRAVAVAAAFALGAVGTANAWDRGEVETFAVIPPDATTGQAVHIEGLTVGSNGNVYTPSFNPTAAQGPADLFEFSPDGQLVRQVKIQNSSPAMLGLAFTPGGKLLVLDFGAGNVLQVDPVSGNSVVAGKAPLAGSGLNALTFDKKGNAYISDSFNGAVYKLAPNAPVGGNLTIWYQSTALLGPGTGLTPPFGANGVEFNGAGSILFVANTAQHEIIQIPVNADGSAGTASVFVTGLNAPDGIAIDRDDNIWVCSNQQDEIDVLDKTGKVIAKLGDFNGISGKGESKGFLFPASPAFTPDGKSLLVSNLGLDLRTLGLNAAIDSQWAAEVKHYTISRIRAVIPKVGGGDDD